MEHLADLSVGDLQQALDSVEGKNPTQRLIAAIAYKNGVTQSELADWFGVERKTIYNWLTRLEHRDLDMAVRDAPRPGRPRKLSAAQLEALNQTLHDPPTGVGYEAPAWTTELVRRYIHDHFGIDYSPPSCRRLMKGAGLRPLTPSQAAVEVAIREPEWPESKLKDLGHVWLPA